VIHSHVASVVEVDVVSSGSAPCPRWVGASQFIDKPRSANRAFRLLYLWQPSPYGSRMAEHLACDLAARSLVIVSGLARGVDSCAHRGALSARGKTVAVFDTGVDVIYPRAKTSAWRSRSWPPAARWFLATSSYAFRPLFAPRHNPFAQISKSWIATPGASR
jgi:hypothetical protein